MDCISLLFGGDHPRGLLPSAPVSGGLNSLPGFVHGVKAGSSLQMFETAFRDPYSDPKEVLPDGSMVLPNDPRQNKPPLAHIDNYSSWTRACQGVLYRF